MDTHKRVGRFRISDEMIRFNPEIAQKVLSKVIVVRCEKHFWGYYEYLALSNRFDIVEEGVIAPYYDAVIKNGFVSFEKEAHPSETT